MSAQYTIVGAAGRGGFGGACGKILLVSCNNSPSRPACSSSLDRPRPPAYTAPMNLVTGATGLLGSHLCEQLVQRGQPVRALVRRSSDTAFLESLGVETAYGDITDPSSLPAALKGVRIVYHAAARVGDWGPWDEFVAISIRGTDNMLKAAAAAGVERFQAGRWPGGGFRGRRR
mgnify:FL=1